jgi:hypothetical protein
MAPGKVEIGAEILLQFSWEFGKSIEWAVARLGLDRHVLAKSTHGGLSKPRRSR